MTSILYQAYTTTQGRTWNGGKTNTSSLSKCVDMFFNAGSMRGKDIIPMFAEALAEDEDKALRILQWVRDVRGGAGERQLFRDGLKYLEKTNHIKLVDLILKTPEIGRWDDLLEFETEPYKFHAYTLISSALKYNNGLCAKWMPRKGPIANELRKFMNLTPRSYRKLLVRLTNVVETQMCEADWEAIDFNKLPSLAAARYASAFDRNSKRYKEYLASLQKGEAKVNVGAVYPYDVVKALHQGNVQFANEQWKALPDYLEGTEERMLPVVDVSGSMYTGKPRYVDVAVSLGLYLSERIQGEFKDTFMTFSASPEMLRLKGTLEQRCSALVDAPWGYNTDISAVFNTLLHSAITKKVPQENMPTTIIILSDMEFDPWVVGDSSVKTIDAIRMAYAAHGYLMPKLIWWNMNGRKGNVPVTYDESGTALVSGFSPAIMTSLLSAEDFSPEAIMNKVIMKDRYKL